ncbi:Pr6Pr family membrane protein [Micrococcaceae bacterium RIT802]|nr:Pr6Pr family membrane protein [Micrococcaceae bacterium RIT 802]
MRRATAIVRIIAAVAVIAAVISTFLDTSTRSPVNPFNFFGFFTVQSNLIAAAVLAATALTSLLRRPIPATLVIVRAAATTYMVVTGVVYNTLLTGLPGGIDLDWANTVLHLVFPVYCLLDWLLFPDTFRVPLRKLGYVAAYPLAWLAVVLVRGATDGWVPYPFLDPSHGYVPVALSVVGIAVAIVGIGALVFTLGSSGLRQRRTGP